MRNLAFIVPIFFALAARGAPRAVPAPVEVPYASDRKLLTSDFVRFDWVDHARKDRSVPVKIYFPTDGAGPFPVIVFSHGLGGTRETYEYLARQWSAHGYVVIHPQHIGSDDKVWRESDGKPMQAMRAAANLQNSLDRVRDVHFVLDQLDALNHDDPKLKGKLDLARIGMSGHSFGAQTTMLIAGQKLGMANDLKDQRVRAAIAMSAGPPVLKNNLDGAYADIAIPVFLMTGTNDNSPIGDTKADERRIPFDHLKHTAYLLTLTGGDHMVFSGRLAPRPNDEKFQRLIRISSTAFWDAYLKDDDVAKKWLAETGFKDALGADGTFEMKN